MQAYIKFMEFCIAWMLRLVVVAILVSALYVVFKTSDAPAPPDEIETDYTEPWRHLGKTYTWSA
ncbi:MAG: hypothetical protein O6944_01335 [Gammaproteobacteria bacterium]|nr:hypothetical protein [Gammaproteobacteria bacterium]